MSLVGFIGWIGTSLYLINHGYLSVIKDWRPTIYYSGNFIAAMALLINGTVLSSWQAVVINSFWAIISLLLLFSVDLKKLASSKVLFEASLATLFLGLLIKSTYQFKLDTQWLAWSSSYIFCSVYLLFSSEKIGLKHYLLWNFLAAIILLPQLALDANWPNFWLEVVWASISIIGFIRKWKAPDLMNSLED